MLRKPEAALEDAATEIQARAAALMHRESTDFFGRMSEALCCAEGEIGDTENPTAEQLEEYRDNMVELAALAMAQAALSSRRTATDQ